MNHSTKSLILLSCLLLAGATAAGGPSAAPTGADGATPKEIIAEARSLENAGMYASAAAQWARSIRRFPHDERVSQAILSLGRCHLANKDYRAAELAFDALTKLSGTSADELYEAWHLLGLSQRFLCRARSGGELAAAQSFKRAYDLNPNGKHARHDLFFHATCLMEHGQEDEARRAFSRITERWDDGDCVPDAWLWLGRLTMAHGDDDAAAEFFAHVIQKWPDLHYAESAHRATAVCDVRAHRYAQAAQHLLTAAARTDVEGSCEWLYDAASCLELDGQAGEAMKSYERVTQQFPGSKRATDALNDLRRLSVRHKKLNDLRRLSVRHKNSEKGLEGTKGSGVVGQGNGDKSN